MTKTTFAVLAALVLSVSAASAQSFDAAVADASAAARDGIKRVRAAAPQEEHHGAYVERTITIAYFHGAKSIVCANPPKASELPANLKFYTHLDGKPVSKLPVDDTASQLNDYRSSGFQNGKWYFSATSCDTQDYFFDFDLKDLTEAPKSGASKPVKGHARVETRGQVDFEGDIDCVANF